MTIRQQGGVFGRNPTFNDLSANGVTNLEGAVSLGSNLTVSSNQPDIVAIDENATAGFAGVRHTIDAGNYRMQTITSAGAFVSNDYMVDKNTSGPTQHRWRIGNTDRLTLNSTGLNVSGALSKGSGSFKIDHPLKPDTHYLVHSFVEGPQADNIYRGKVALVDGMATVNLDEAGRMTEGTFVALNGNVQCFTTNEGGWTAVRGSVDGNVLTIKSQDATCADMVSWLVIGERQDQHMIDTDWTDENGRVIVEPKKEGSK
jgi:hypothetical protein